MVKGLVNDTSLSAIGDVIREAKGETKYLNWSYSTDTDSMKDDLTYPIPIPDNIPSNGIYYLNVIFPYGPDYPVFGASPYQIYSSGGDQAAFYCENPEVFSTEDGKALLKMTVHVGESWTRFEPIMYFNYYQQAIVDGNYKQFGPIRIEITSNFEGDIPNPATNYLPSEMAEEVTTILNASGQYQAFTNKRCANSSDILIIPDSVTSIGPYAFRNSQAREIILPNGTCGIYSFTFMECHNLRNFVFPQNIEIRGQQLFASCENLSEVTFNMPISNIRINPKAIIFNQSSVQRLYVPSKYYRDYVNSGETFPKLVSLHDTDLTELVITGSRQANLFVRPQLSYAVLYNDIDSAYDEQRGVTWSCSGKATISEDGVVTIDESAEVGDIITVTATSTYNQDISSSIDIECVYVTRTYSVDLSQWEVSNKPSPTGDTLYQSFSNYHQANQIARTRISLIGFNKLVLYAMYSGERNYDYTVLGELNTNMKESIPIWDNAGEIPNRPGVKEHFYNFDSGEYKRVEYTCTGGEDFIDILYGKDSSSDQNDDRGYFYIAESECE